MWENEAGWKVNKKPMILYGLLINIFTILEFILLPKITTF